MILRCCGTPANERQYPLALISQSAAAALDHQTIYRVRHVTCDEERPQNATFKLALTWIKLVGSTGHMI
jgi:hypothetical protein